MVLAILGLCSMFSAYAVNPGETGSGSGNDHVIIWKGKIGSGRHTTPSNQYILMYYNKDNMTCYFHLTSEMPHLHVVIQETSTGAKFEEDVFIDAPYMQQSIDKGSYLIKCVDDTGNIYLGSFEVN